jgi:hypothetical protein
MNKEEFLAEPDRGWFLQATENYQIDQLRADVGASFGWTDRDWYTDDEKLIKFLDVIEQNKRRDQLLYALKEAVSSDEKKLSWLESVDQKNLTDSPAPPPSAAPGAGPATTAPTASATATAGTAPSTDAPKKSIFKKAQPEPALATPPAAPPGQAPAPAAAGDVAKKSIFKKAQPAPATAATETPTAPAPATGEGLDQIQEEIKVAMARLSADELSSVAQEAGVSAEELKVMLEDPEFAQMVAEERVKLGSSGA